MAQNISTHEFEALWARYGGDPKVAPTMAALMLQQSGGDPTSVNSNDPGPYGSVGLLQINSAAHPDLFAQFGGENGLRDTVNNIKAAVELYKKDGLQPWATVNAPGGGTMENPVVTAYQSGQNPLEAVAAQGSPSAVAGEPMATASQTATGGAPLPSTAAQPMSGYQLPTVAPYTGPGAYKGFDLSSLSPQLVSEAKSAIDQYLTQPNLEQSVLTDIQNNYGAESWAASDPQIRTLLVVGSVLDWAKDPNLFQSQVLRTTWWKTNSENKRAYEQLAGTDPAQAHQALLQAQARVVDMANQLGVQLTKAQTQRISSTVAEQSVTQGGVYSATSFSDQQVAQMIASQFNSNTFAGQMSASPTGTVAPGTTGAASGQPVGDAADLYNQFQAIAKEYYLPLNSKQIAQQVQKYIEGYTGQGSFVTGATQGFETYAKQMAGTLYPALAGIIGTSNANGGTAQTPYSALAGYRTLIANYTGYQGDPDTINLSSPQWSWILTGSSPKGSGTAGGTQPGYPTTGTSANAPATLPTYDKVQKYLMQQPQYQSTDMAKTQAWQVATAILKNFGYVG